MSNSNVQRPKIRKSHPGFVFSFGNLFFQCFGKVLGRFGGGLGKFGEVLGKILGRFWGGFEGGFWRQTQQNA